MSCDTLPLCQYCMIAHAANQRFFSEGMFHPAGLLPMSLQYEDPADGLQSLRTFLDVKRALELDWVLQAAAERLAALAADKGKGGAAANGNGSIAGSGKVAARAVAAAHPLAAPPAALERLRKELRLSRLQAGLVWRALLLVAGRGEAPAAAGVESLIRQAILAQVAEAKGDAQGETRRHLRSPPA